MDVVINPRKPTEPILLLERLQGSFGQTCNLPMEAVEQNRKRERQKKKKNPFPYVEEQVKRPVMMPVGKQFWVINLD